jgi:hypothetical protein
VIFGSVFVSVCCFFLCYGCASMLFSVTFYVGMRDVWMLQGSVAEMAVWMKKERVV